MIKINLLPRIVNEKRAVRNTAIMFGVLLVAVLVAGMTYNSRLHAAVLSMEEQAKYYEDWKARVDQINSDAGKIEGETKPIQDKVKFINDVLEYNGKFPRLYEDVARWTYEKVQYSSLQSDGKVLQMQMRVKSLDDLGRYLLNLYRATDLFTSVSISALPGYPRGGSGQAGYPVPGLEFSGGEMGGSMADLAGMGAIATGTQRTPGSDYFDITVTCTLKTPIEAPAFAGAAAGAAPAQATGGMLTSDGDLQVGPGPVGPGGPGPQPPAP